MCSSLANNLDWTYIPIERLLSILLMPANLMFGQVDQLMDAILRMVKLAMLFDRMVSYALVNVYINSINQAHTDLNA